MRIICYINKLNDGGAERVMSVLANELSKCRHMVTVVTDYAMPNEYPLRVDINRVIFDGEFTNSNRATQVARTVSRIYKLRKICKDTRADIVISFIHNANYRAILATRFLKTKNLISVRVAPQIGYQRKLTAIAAKILYPLADGCVFQTEEAKEWFSYNIQKKSCVIQNPVSNAFYEANGTPMKDKRIVACGRLEDQKRFDLLITAFDKICDRFPDYKLEIYGTGSLKERLSEQILCSNRGNRIALMGRCEDIPDAIKDASIFVLSSDFEGLPNALMEAMALGLCVVSTDCCGGGARAVIKDGIDGTIVPPNDVDALAEALEGLLSNKERMEQLGAAARKRAKNFSPEVIFGEWEKYICQKL